MTLEMETLERGSLRMKLLLQKVPRENREAEDDVEHDDGDGRTREAICI